ncbi:MAG: hypothetical protein IT310_05835 [Anaerolineales bacterium]|nr:hypothetical protein [Anaerolineales bacterium]
MNTNTSRTTILWGAVGFLVLAGIITLIFSFRGNQKDAVAEVNLIYTNAAATLEAQQLTLQAALSTATPDPALSTPTLTVTPLTSPTAGLPPTLAFATSTLSSAPVTKCDNAVYMADVTIPDGTTFGPGATFTKTWRVVNTGTCTWSATYQLVFVSGDVMSGKAVALGKTVAPGQTAEISVTLTAAATTGNLKGTWRLQNDQAQQFGDALTVVIKVGAVTGTPATSVTSVTAAVTATIETPSPATPTPTNTSVPADTPTITETPTTPGP